MRLSLTRLAALVVMVSAVAARAQEPLPYDAYDEPPLDDPAIERTPPPPPVEEYQPRLERPLPSGDATLTGAVRGGVYSDSDRTTVWRVLAAIARTAGRWTVSGSASVDIVSSASVDVRSSPALSKVEVITGASGQSSTTTGGTMSDRRIQVTGGFGWRDGSGKGINLSTSFANERDYDSVSGGLNGSVDLFHRMTTLLGGVAVTNNWIGSVLDSSFARSMYEIGGSLGVAQVLSRSDALRLRYDVSLAEGYQASPYRNVRFGNWTTSVTDTGRINFGNTIGSADGLPETVPDSRLRHAGTLEWVHSFVEGLAVHLTARAGIDSWGVQSATAGISLRAVSNEWRLQLGYRYYTQSAADFFATKYTLASSNYQYFTSDKELGRETGHIGSLDIAHVLKAPEAAGDNRLLLDLQVVGMSYSYPGFALLDSRSSVLVTVGLTWEL